MIKNILIIALFVVNSTILAAPTCSQNGTDVIYTNGILTSEKQAKIALKKVKSLNLDSEIDTKDVKYRLAYNYSQDFAHDFLETIVQRMPQSFLKQNGYRDGYAAYMNFLSGEIGNLFSKVVLDDIFLNIKEIELQLVQHQNTVDTILAFYEAAFASKRKILAISHSQGGLFLNDAYGEFVHPDKEKFFAGLEIATPASFLNPHLSDYATHDRDQVINFVRSSIGTLAPNIDGGLVVGNTFNELGDWTDFVLNHGIVTTYLADDELKAAVIAKIVSTAEKLESNCSTYQLSITSINPFNPPFFYLWSTLQTTNIIEVPAGIYEVCIMDGTEAIRCKEVKVGDSLCRVVNDTGATSFNFNVVCESLTGTTSLM